MSYSHPSHQFQDQYRPQRRSSLVLSSPTRTPDRDYRDSYVSRPQRMSSQQPETVPLHTSADAYHDFPPPNGSPNSYNYDSRPDLSRHTSGYGSYEEYTPTGSKMGLAGYNEKHGLSSQPPRRNRRKWLWIALGLLALIIAAVVVGVVVAKNKSSNKKSAPNSDNDTTGGGSSSGGGAGGGSSTANPVTQDDGWVGYNGTQITMENGQKFTYINNFGGHWDARPFSDNAQAQSDVPALNTSWDYSKYAVNGVNLGGWLVIEPFIVPGLFEPFENTNTPAIDEWSLTVNLGDKMQETITNHYDTFITEQDFARIAGAGLNWIRLPIPWWCIEVQGDEPFLEGVAWKYVLKAFEWARKYGLRINLDYHAAPGSQNGWNHSGKFGQIGFLRGVMGVANAQRSLNYIRTLQQFISQPQYKNVVPMFSILNEPRNANIGDEVMSAWTLEAYKDLRSISGIGDGNGPMLVMHDGFSTLPVWKGFMEGSDRMGIDSHTYMCFAQPNDDSIGYSATKPCNYWQRSFNQSQIDFGVTMSGEWCLAVNDCGQYINNVGNGNRYEGTWINPDGNSTTPQFSRFGSCDSWNDWASWDDTMKNSFKSVAQAHMDSFRHWFFWTWKIGNSTRTGGPINPMWSYSLGLEQGYMVENPRQAQGACQRILQAQGVAALQDVGWDGGYSAWQTGGSGAGTIVANTASYAQFPPAALTNVPTASFLPTYTPTGTPITLSAAAPTSVPSGSSTPNPGNGWFDASDTAGYYTAIPSCSAAYVDPWSGNAAPIPTAPAC